MRTPHQSFITLRSMVHRLSVLCIWLPLVFLLRRTVNAFVTSPYAQLPKRPCLCTSHNRLIKTPSALLQSSKNDVSPPDDSASPQLTHADIEWKLRPQEGTSRINRLKLKLGANVLRLESKLKGGELPPVLCPKGGRAVLEAYYKGTCTNNYFCVFAGDSKYGGVFFAWNCRAREKKEENCQIWHYYIQRTFL